jgi:hypothetical protein
MRPREPNSTGLNESMQNTDASRLRLPISTFRDSSALVPFNGDFKLPKASLLQVLEVYCNEFVVETDIVRRPCVRAWARTEAGNV